MNDLVPTLKLSLEMTDTLSRIERNGIRINLDTLDQIEKLAVVRFHFSFSILL